ncbi:MAG: cellulase N-terminal Ig-like domain-containing protein, partial [Prolixibacteraceae bacterium]
MNGLKLLIAVTTLLFLSPTTLKASDIIDVAALNSKTILLHFDDGYVRYHQKGESRSNEWVIAEPLDITKAEDALNFQIKSADGFYAEPKNPLNVKRKTKGTEFTWLCQSWSQAVGCVNSDADHAKEHWLYLHLPEPLEQGQKYVITTNDVAGNGNSWELEFNLEENRSEAIHVNLVGYDPRAPKKYGYVYHWGGSAGSIDFSEYSGNNFYLIDNQTKEKVYTGKLEFRKSKTNIETRQANDTPNQNFLGADVWECDFSDFNTPGEYILAVDGIGRSFPFKIKKDIYRLPYYTSIRGLYHNRSGIALEEPYTEFTRPAPHNPLKTPGFKGKLLYTTSRFIDWKNLNHSKDDLPAIEDGIQGAIDTWGWYQDAGDWDGYFWHMKIPAVLMLTWEIAPEKFADGELNIPEGENGIPDILDEASWLIRFYHRTRHAIMEKGYGTGGVGSRVAPDWYGHAEDGTPSYEDTGKWIISGEDPFTTYFYAGLAGHYAAVLNKLGVEDPNGTDWQKEAEEAFNWAKNNTKTKDTNPDNVHDYNIHNFQLYAAASLFRLTGDEKYAQLIEQRTASLEGNKVLDEDEKWGTYSLVVSDEFDLGNQPLMDKLKNAVLTTADQKNNSVEQRACRYGGNIWMPMLIGQGTTPRVFEIMLGHFVSKE